MKDHTAAPRLRANAERLPHDRSPRPRPSGVGDCYPDVLPPEQRLETLLMAGIWLVFLAIPAWSLVAEPELTVAAKALGLAALLVFCLIYLTAFVRTRPVTALPRWANTLLYQVLLLTVVIAGVPSIGTDVVLTTPFLCAMWLFCHPWPVGLAGTAAVVLVNLTIVWFFASAEDRTWSLIPIVISVGFIVAVRYATGREERTRTLKERLALAAQREAFGREVHDALGHSLTLMSVKVQLARRHIATDPDRAETELDEVRDLITAAIAEARTVVTRVGAEADQLSLTEQISAAVRALGAAGVSTDAPAPEVLGSLPPAQDALFAACLREAVTNIIRHSRAEHVSIAVEPDRLVVVDDGVGGAAAARARAAAADREPAGHGLPGMAARARAASARLRVTDARPGHHRPGTRVEVDCAH
ncbi:two-component system sensor histidine kinase DesK [Brevibacterium sanguinis]|uniref:Two-component system sensor histidine kinase DesK n=2 Tax=Brevibacterium TaxID=1696 RepID=A0A366IH22_9MICO|nr:MULTISPECIES: histidine kinase [Brevibacterium]RBP61617.1 two-component system sensor histidine kinase DesK [Brevibacterium sanguinis]RBP70869.1 two-component system sensor histidine kinase DesK [Brevibacterium celere]